MTAVRSLSIKLDLPVSRVLRRALVKAARTPGAGHQQAGVALLRDATAQDEDTGDWSTGQLLARLAKGESASYVVELMDMALQSDVTLPIDIVGDICDSFANKGRVDLVQQAVGYLRRTNQPLNDFIHSTVVLSHAKRNDPVGALNAYKDVPDPNQVHLSILVECLARNGYPKEALGELDRFASDNPDEPIKTSLVGRVAGALAEVNATAGVDKLLETLNCGGSIRPAMLTPVLCALDRLQEHREALRLLNHLAARGVEVSDRNLDALVTCLRGVREPSDLMQLAPQLRLLRARHWADLLRQNMPPDDRNPAWLQLVRTAVAPPEGWAVESAIDANAADNPVSGLVSALQPALFARLLNLAVHTGDRGSLRWLLQHRGNVSRRNFETALRLAVDTGDAELARLLVTDMFVRGVAPDIDIFRSVASSYSGSLGEVLRTFDDLVSRASQGNPDRLARLLVTAVLTQYAATNQARQWGDVLAKFGGWPKLQDWKLMDGAMVVLTTSRPRDAADAARLLMPSLGPLPPHLLGQAVLWAARTGDLVGVRGLLGLADELLGKPDALTRRRAGLLALTDRYYRLGGASKSLFQKLPFSRSDGEEWLPDVQQELALIGALVMGDRARARRTFDRWRGRPVGELPLRALVTYILVAEPDDDALEELLLTLRARFPDASLEIEEAVDRLDAAQGRHSELVSRLLSPGSFITMSKVEAYAATVFDSVQDREQALARYRMLSRGVPDDQRAQLLLRAFSEIHANRAEPEAVRRVFDDLAVLTHPGPRAWAELQRAARNSPEGPVRVLEEMLAAGSAPDLRNLRPIVASLGKRADFAAAEQIIERFDAALTDVEKSALLSQLVLEAASIDEVDLAEQLRDKVWALSQTLTPGADAAWHAARVRAGLEQPLTGLEGQSVQLEMDVFVRDVAHDLENLLGSVWTGIEFALQILESGGNPDKAIRQLAPVRDVTKPRFDRLMEHWQTMADDGARSGEQADVGRAVRRLFGLQQEIADAIGVRLEGRVPDGRFFVQVSAMHLDIILRQLLDNAIRHLAQRCSDDKYVRVLVSEAPESTASLEHAPIRISVFDNGPGIPAEHRSAIYESGFSTKAGRGVGRGLALVNSVVSLVGGAISVESRAESECDPGQAPFTQFNITLPRTLGERNRAGEDR